MRTAPFGVYVLQTKGYPRCVIAPGAQPHALSSLAGKGPTDVEALSALRRVIADEFLIAPESVEFYGLNAYSEGIVELEQIGVLP